ncbi:hypothetical protein [Alteromonas stellipolaris]|uniref:hypothetical protein n=1 Tax=Alteromonas stellipolaris TaxID=233316 RepID=UPI0012E3692B
MDHQFIIDDNRDHLIDHSNIGRFAYFVSGNAFEINESVIVKHRIEEDTVLFVLKFKIIENDHWIVCSPIRN